MSLAPPAPDSGADIRPPSMQAGGFVMPPSADAHISAGQAASAAFDQVNDITTAMQQAALYSGEIEKNFKQIARQSKDMHHEALVTAQAVKAQGVGRAVAERVAAPANNGPEPDPGFRPSAASSGRVAPPSDDGFAEGRSSSAPGAQRFRDMNFGQGREMGESLSDLKRNVAIRTNRWMSEWGQKYKPGTNAAGEYVDEAGNVTEASKLAGKDWERGMNRIGRVQGVVNAVGEGEGLSGMIGKIGGRFAGPVGVALGAGMMVNDQIISQRKNNAFYQNIYGGSNTDATGQRLQEQVFSHFGTMGLMDSGEASQLFRGVSSLGLQGDRRQGALNFATEQYRNSGMDAQTSLELIRTATENGVENLDSLSGALDQVGEAAKRSGKSVKEAQEDFVAAYKAVAGNVAVGSAAANVAGGLTSFKEGLGHQLGSVDFNPLVTNQRNQMIAAAQLGMDPQTLMAQMQTNEGNIAGRSAQSLLNMVGQQAINRGQLGSAQAEYERLKKENGGHLTDEDWTRIGSSMVESGALNAMAAQQMLASLGVNMTMPQAISFFARQAMGDQATNAEKPIGANEGGKGAFDKGTGSHINGSSLRQSTWDTISGAKMEQHKDLEETVLGMSRGPLKQLHAGGEANRDAVHAYEDLLDNKGATRMAGVEGLLKQKLDSQTRLRVRDANGNFKDVGLQEAVKHYSDQIEGGNVEITRGKKAGATVGELTGVYDDAATKKKQEQQSRNGKVTIEAKGALAQFLNIQASGGAEVAGAKRLGQPTGAFPLFPSSLDSATGSR